MTRPATAPIGRTGRRRPAPALSRWSPADLARRRALATAHAEAEAAGDRGDPPPVVAAWADVVDALAHAVPTRDLEEPA